MTAQNVKKLPMVTTAVLIAVVSVLVLGAGAAYAEPPDRLRDEASEGKQL